MGKIHLNLSSFIVFDICIAITGLYPETAICVCTLPKNIDFYIKKCYTCNRLIFETASLRFGQVLKQRVGHKARKRRKKEEMKVKKSEMLSVMGTVWEIVKSIWNAVLELGGTDEDMKKILRPDGLGLAKGLALVILGKAKVVLIEVSSDFNSLEFWTSFYQDYFSFTAGFSGLEIPPRPVKGRWRLLVILKGLTINQVYDVCASKFRCVERGNLDIAIPTNERDSKTGSYAIWVRDTVEADEIHKNKSANMVKAESLKTETVLERVIHELVYFLETGEEHLDVNNITLCSGSRGSAGGVPGANWGDGRFRVCCWCDLDSRYINLRPREVVTL